MKIKQAGFHGMKIRAWRPRPDDDVVAFGAEWQELALVTPPLLPEEQWSPGRQVLKEGGFLTLRDGYACLPDLTGIGLDIDEDALARYRV
ncbi:MAG: hypothetical protein ACYC3X_26435 [Pirellulaceae bacterium]